MSSNGASWRNRSVSSTPSSGERPVFSQGPFRGRFYQRGRGSTFGGHPSVPRIPGKNILGGLYPSTIQTFEKPADVPGSDDVVIDDVQYITSYSWMDVNEPTILVPGAPQLPPVIAHYQLT